MAFITTKFGDVVSYKISYESNMTNTVTKNVTGGSGTLYSVKIVNGDADIVYIKLTNGLSATSGSTAPDWIFPCAASSTQTYEIPGGVTFDALSCWATQNPSPSDNTTPGVTGNQTVAVTLLTRSTSQASASSSSNGY